LLLKVNQDIEGTVKLSQNIVAVVITCVGTARLALRTRVVALTKRGYWHLASSLNLGRELLNAVETVKDTARGTRSDSVGHVKHFSRDLEVSGKISTRFARRKQGILTKFHLL
jgi:hypothetical protein